MDYTSLISGTDIRGTAIGENAVLTAKAASDIAAAFLLKLGVDKPTVAVGRDSRISGEALAEAVIDALKNMGATVYSVGLCSTPSMFMMTKLADCDGAIMLTASHHPYDKNGMKFFTPEGGISSKELKAIVQRAGEGDFPQKEGGRVCKDDYLSLYCAHMRDIIKAELGEDGLRNFKIAVDAGNGAAGFYATRILQPLGADVSSSQFLEPDGMFPNHQPNPENPVAMESISKRVRESGADLGIIFDTDGDRCAIVTSDGAEINRNRLIALISSIILEEHKGAYIVTDSVTSDGLAQFIKDRGGVHIRYKRGYKNVIDYAKKLCDEGKYAPLAIETSGHAAMKENYFLDDGAYLVTLLLVKSARLKKEGKSLSDLILSLREPQDAAEVRLPLIGEEWKTNADAIIEAVKNATASSERFVHAPDNHEGIRVNIPELRGWFLIRKSVHDPIMPVNAESEIEGGCKGILNELYGILSAFERELELTPIKKYLG